MDSISEFLLSLPTDKHDHIKALFAGDSDSLDLGHTKLNSKTFACLVETAPVNRLKSVDLRSNPNIIELPSGTKFSALEHFNLSKCTNVAVATIFSSYPGLNSLSLACCRLSTIPDDFESICILEHLNLRGNRFVNLPTLVTRLNHIKELNLSGNRLSDAAMVALVPAFSAPTSQLESLYLANNYIHARGAHALAQGLTKNRSTLKLLVLTGNIIGDDGSAAILSSVAICASHRTALRTLRLDACDMGDNAARALAAAVRANTYLRSLSIGRNRLGNEAIITLSRALEDQRGCLGLTDLNLSDNWLGADSAVALAAVLLRNNALLRLSLAGNDSLIRTSRAAAAFADGIARNKV